MSSELETEGRRRPRRNLEDRAFSGGSRVWSYSPSSEAGRPAWVVRAGERVVGWVDSKGDADIICHSRQVALRELNRAVIEARQHRAHVMRMEEDIRLLVSTLRKVANSLRLLKPREITAAREVAARTLMKLKNMGYKE